jgi:Ca2+:H+ antiporter
LSVGLAVLLIVSYALGLLYSLQTHRELFASSASEENHEESAWPIGLALVTLAGVTVLVALISEIFVESVQKATESFGMSQASVSSWSHWWAARLKWRRRFPAHAKTGST